MKQETFGGYSPSYADRLGSFNSFRELSAPFLFLINFRRFDDNEKSRNRHG